MGKYLFKINNKDTRTVSMDLAEVSYNIKHKQQLPF